MLIRSFPYIVLLNLVLVPISSAQEMNNSELASRLRRSYQPRINVGTEIPLYPQYYSWKVTGELAGVKVHEGSVPVYDFDPVRNMMIAIGQVEIGTKINLDKFMNYNQKNYFLHAFKDPAGREVTGWLDGSFISREDANSYAPGQNINTTSQ